jgi:hypothetical protein
VIDVVRLAAVAVGVLMAIGPSVAAVAKKLAEGEPTPEAPTPARPAVDAAASDAHLVLDIAGRLRAAGNAKGVDLCGQLIDAMFQEPGK